MKKIKFFLILLIIPFISLRPSYVKSINPEDHINLEFSKDYGGPGDLLTLNIQVSYPGFNLKIFYPNGSLAYNNNFTGSNRSLPIVIQEPFGFYKVVVSIPDVKTTSFFTSLDNKNFELLDIPYSLDHRGVQYTFRKDWTLKANDLVLNFHFIKFLIDKYDLDYTVLKNSMNVVIRLRKSDVFQCDIIFSFIHRGLKFSINGTQDKPREFTINLNYGRKFLNSFKFKDVVFDYSDVPKGAYIIHNYALTLLVPENFNIDPVIFSDGFESNDYSAWDGTADFTATITTQGTVVHAGSYASKTSMAGAQANDYAVAYKNLASSHVKLHVRAYVRVTNKPVSGERLDVYPGIFNNGATVVMALAGIYNDGGTYKWSVRYYTNGGANQLSYSSGATINNNEWYAIEVKCYEHGSDGNVELFINGVSVINVTSIANDNEENQRVEIGGYKPGNGLTVDIFTDSVVVDDEYIGLEGADNSPPVWSSLSESSTLAGNSSTFNSYWYDVGGNLSHYIFQWNNTGSIVNDSAVSFPALNNTWLPISKTLNATVGITICWRVYGNDTANNWNVTSQRCFITTVNLEEDILSVNDMVFIFCLFQLILGIIAIVGVPWLGLIAIFLGFLLLIPVPVSTPGTFLFDMQIYSLVISSFMALLGIVLHWDKFI